MSILHLTPKPNYKLIGHRGAAGLRPENTLVGFNYARELNLNWIEYDVRLTKDEEWVLMHDKLLDRTTNGSGLVSEHNLSQLTNLDAGSWFTPPFPLEKIPTLLETFELCASLDINQNIEVKGSKASPDKHAKLMHEFLTKYIPPNFPHPLVSNFDLQFNIKLRELSPTLPIGYLINQFESDTIDIALQNEFTTINCSIEHITEEDIQRANDHKIPVLIYTVNDPKLAQKWLEHGASALFTDRPDLMIAELYPEQQTAAIHL